MEVGDLVQLNVAMKEKRLSYYMTSQHSVDDIGIIIEVKQFMVIVY